jgi:hypothetical protein
MTDSYRATLRATCSASSMHRSKTAIATIEFVTIEAADTTAAHAVAHRVPASHRQRPHRHRRRRRRHVAEAGREVAVGLRRCRTSPGRDDLDARFLGEEGDRPGLPADRRDRAPAWSRGCRREQAVLRLSRLRRGEQLWPEACRVRHGSRQADALITTLPIFCWVSRYSTASWSILGNGNSTRRPREKRVATTK